MKLAGEEPATLNAIVITHEHQDHMNGLAVTARKLGIPVYFTEATHRAWMRWLTPRRTMTYAQWLEQCRKQAAERQAEAEDAAGPKASLTSWRFRRRQPNHRPRAALLDAPTPEPPTSRPKHPKIRPSFAQGGSNLAAGRRVFSGWPVRLQSETSRSARSPFPTMPPIPWDSSSSAEGVRMGFATDLGYIPPNVKAQLKGVDLLLLESNHDLEMLRDGPYPWSVKQRVLSRVGHLSNDAAAEFLSTGYDGQAAYVILAHLSESNNLPELARVSADRALRCRASLLANRLLLAEQHQPMDPITF